MIISKSQIFFPRASWGRYIIGFSVCVGGGGVGQMSTVPALSNLTSPFFTRKGTCMVKTFAFVSL